MNATFTLDDFMSQMGQVKNLGPVNKVMGKTPG
jgi:signal recognition particle GTPase